MQNWKSVSTFGEIIAKIQRKWKNPCKIWSVSNMTTCSNWIRQCWRHCQASSYLSCGNVQLPIPKKDKQHPPNIDWWEAGSDCIVFQPIHTIQAIVWKGLHWVVLASEAHRMFWLCSCFEFDAWALLSDKSVAWATFQSATSTNCRINVPWMALAPQLLLFACPTNTPVISNHATAHSLLVHLARDVHPNNIRNFLADVVDHCELNLTLMTLHIPLLEYCRLPCKVCLPWGAIFGMDSISQLLIIGVHQCCFEIPFAMRVRKRDMAIHHGKLQHIMSLLRVRSQFLHLGQQLQAGGAWTFTHHLLGYLPQKRTFLLLMLSEPCWWVMGCILAPGLDTLLYLVPLALLHKIAQAGELCCLHDNMDPARLLFDPIHNTESGVRRIEHFIFVWITWKKFDASWNEKLLRVSSGKFALL